MIYNFQALESDSDEGSYDGDSTLIYNKGMSDVEKKKKEIERLKQIRDEKRKQLLALQKDGPNDDKEHQQRIKDLNKQALKLSKSVEEKRNEAVQLENKLKTIPGDTPIDDLKPKSEQEIQNEAIRNLRHQVDSLKTEVSKAKKALALEGGNKRTALQIKKLKAQLAELPVEEVDDDALPTKSVNNHPDYVELKNDVTQLQDDHKALKLKLNGLQSRISILEKQDIKPKLKKSLDLSNKNDQLIEMIKPKEKVQKKEQYKGHVSQRSRLSVIICGLHKELYERTKELNTNKVLDGEHGVQKEIERLQKRLHLLESSISCIL